MGHVDAREAVVFERPRVTVQVPHMVGGGVWRDVDSNGIRLDFACAAADVEGHGRLLYHVGLTCFTANIGRGWSCGELSNPTGCSRPTAPRSSAWSPTAVRS